MTKINKLGKSTFVIAILSFLLVAVLAFGGTYAYFSADDSMTSGNITLGNLTINLEDGSGNDAEISTVSNVVPGQYIVGTKEAALTYKIDLTGSNINAFLRLKIEAEITSPVVGEESTNDGGDASIDETNFFIFGGTNNTIAGWVKANDGYFYYVGTVENATTATTAAEANSSAMVDAPISVQVNPLIGEDSSDYFMGAVAKVTVTVEAVQSDWIDGVENTTYTVAQLADAWSGLVSTRD